MATSTTVRVISAIGALILTIVLLKTIFPSTRVPIPRIGQVPSHDWDHDPMLDPTDEPRGPLHRVVGDNYAPDNPYSNRINATLLSLVRNQELSQILQSMKDLERTWNRKFNYPWTFFNDVPFTKEFKQKTQAMTKAECRYELIPDEHWQPPSWINKDLFDESAKMLTESGVQYAEMLSYHQMCRWNSGMFYKHPALENMQYYWRVEPHVHFFCDVDYDVFRFMQDRNKTYGFNIALYDDPVTVTSLWPETQNFISTHADYLHHNNAMDWVIDKERRPKHNLLANGFSTCHFWTNFEIADLRLWRGDAYQAYFDHLDRAGGFFYERWGDAPVHSIGVGLFEDKNNVHWFKDIGYNHIPFLNCPNSPKCSGCTAGKMYDGEPFLEIEDCRPNWFKYAGVGADWETHGKSTFIPPS